MSAIELPREVHEPGSGREPGPGEQGVQPSRRHLRDAVRPDLAAAADHAERLEHRHQVSGSSSAIDRLLARSREGVVRVDVEDLQAEVAAGALVVDTRPVEQRARDGALPGAVVIDRNVLEWRLDPTSPHRIPEAHDQDRRVILVCNEGFSSSLAAATLRELGLLRATDLSGGFQAWLSAGNRPEPPPTS
jgi:rhodanese-related sulfurtransferase